jgi:hypothetical protein
MPPADKHMEASENGYCGDLSSLSAPMRRICFRCARCTLSNRAMRAPVVEITDIFGQDLLQMPLIEDEHVVQALRPDRSHPALGDGVCPRQSDRRAGLGNSETTHPSIEDGAIAAVAVMHENAWRLPKRSIQQFAAPSTRRLDRA